MRITGPPPECSPAAAVPRAACDRVDRTGISPWVLVEADNKPFARLKVLQAVCDRLEAALGG